MKGSFEFANKVCLFIIDMIYNSDFSKNPFETKSFTKNYENFFDKHLSTKDFDEEFENYSDLNSLLDEMCSIAFSAGFKIATQLWLEGLK